MKRLISLFFLILPAMISGSCFLTNDTCVECEIYNNYGNYVEYYGSECGSALRRNNFESDAENYAEEYYDGYAVCNED
jgi:hypothetical protein